MSNRWCCREIDLENLFISSLWCLIWLFSKCESRSQLYGKLQSYHQSPYRNRCQLLSGHVDCAELLSWVSFKRVLVISSSYLVRFKEQTTVWANQSPACPGYKSNLWKLERLNSQGVALPKELLCKKKQERCWKRVYALFLIME